jgi:DNA-binding response OmpR family regulator
MDITEYLTKLGYEVLSFSTYGGAFAALMSSKCPVDLAVIEVDLNGDDGRALLSDPARGSIPIILYSSRGLPGDIVIGLDMGADDYLVKPAPPSVLEARIRAVLRRARGAGDDSLIPTYSFDGLSIDTRTHEVIVNGEIVEMTAKEFSLLSFLAASPRQVFSRDQLLGSVWGSSSDWQKETTVTEHIRRVRAKIEKDPDNPRWIVTIPGSGYKFERRAPRTIPAALIS